MSGLQLMATAIFQGDSVSPGDVHVAMWCLVIIAIALVAQAVGIMVAGAFAAKLLHRVDGIARVVETKTGPILDKTNEMLHELSPKIHSLTENAEQISYTVRAKVDELSVTVSDLNRTVQDLNVRTRVQVAHVDGIVKDALDATADISKTIQEGVKGPVRQVAGLLAGLRAGLETLVERSPFGGRR